MPVFLPRSSEAPMCPRSPWLLFALLLASAGRAQPPAPPLRLTEVVPAGVRASVTESATRFQFKLTNLSDVDRRGRVLAFYANRPDEQYGRDIWVPARSVVASWFLAGPAPPQELTWSRNLEVLLYDLTDGAERPVIPATGEKIDEKFASRGVPYRKREPVTAALLDLAEREEPVPGQLPQPETPADEALHLTRTFRLVRNLSEFVQVVHPGALPETADAFDGIDHVVVASPRLAADAGGVRALRRWLEGGGRVWVMLDRVDIDGVAPLLGDAYDFQVVGRTSLTRFRVDTPAAGPVLEQQPEQEHERPVDLVRVLLPPGERARHTVDGWPAWFARDVGRGKVVVTTLGARGWYRPRLPADGPPPPDRFPMVLTVPVPREPMEFLAAEVQPAPEESPFRIDDFRPSLSEEIGYAVVGRGAVASVFAVALAAAAGVGLLLRRSRRPELIGALGPVAALAAAAVLAGVGLASRRSAAPTVAAAQLVHAVDGIEEAAVHGLLGVYRPDSGPAPAGATRGGSFSLDTTDLEGRARRRLVADRDAWHWDNLDMPAGVRWAPFRTTVATGEPLAAVATFGPDGLEGTLTTGPFADPDDAVLSPATGRPLAVRLGDGGSFRIGVADVLPSDQFLSGNLLSDRRQRRQEVYRQLLKRRGVVLDEGRTTLYAWAQPADTGFVFAEGARSAGEALLAIPLRLRRPTPGTRVALPGPLLPYRDVQKGRVTMRSGQAADLNLRFQLPLAVLPLDVERVRFTVKIEAPSRRVTVWIRPDKEPVEVQGFDSPLDPIRVELTGARLPKLDADGGLHVRLTVADPPGAAAASRRTVDAQWAMEYLEMEVFGTTRP